MAERTKIVTLYEFYYPDRRPDAPSAFAGNGLAVDHEAGDEIEVERGVYRLTQANGRFIIVPPGWLWMEESELKVKVKDDPK